MSARQEVEHDAYYKIGWGIGALRTATHDFESAAAKLDRFLDRYEADGGVSQHQLEWLQRDLLAAMSRAKSSADAIDTRMKEKA